MGTQFSITVADKGEPAAISAAMIAAFREVARIEALMSEWRPDSEISRINGNAGKRPVKVSVETRRMIQEALALSAASHGAFDPTWAALRGLWKFKTKVPSLPLRSQLEDRLSRVGYTQVIVDEERNTILLRKEGMALGLGAIAKGYAIDRAVQILKAHGLRNFIVDGGGDLYLSGAKKTGSWSIGVRHPRQERLIGELNVQDRAVVTSGDYERFFELGGRRYHHIIDLKTGMPATRSVAVTVLAPNAALADALATALFVMGPKTGLALTEKYSGVDALILTPDGKIHRTTGFGTAMGSSWRLPPKAPRSPPPSTTLRR